MAKITGIAMKNFPSRLRFGAERRGEDAASRGADEGSPIHCVIVTDPPAARATAASSSRELWRSTL
jgi:hypothetical protein